MNEKAEAIVDAILRDLRDRRGLLHVWESIDDHVQEQIRLRWVELAAGELQS